MRYFPIPEGDIFVSKVHNKGSFLPGMQEKKKMNY